MKFIRISLSVLILGVTLALITGCGRGTETVETEEQTVIEPVTRGDLSLDISAVGNLALSDKETLSFGITGTVSEVMVEEGDYVEEGQVLATLDTSERDAQLKTLTRAIETKDQAQLQAEINNQNAEDTLERVNSQGYADQKEAEAELAVANAKISLNNAQDNFDRAEENYESNWTWPPYIRQYDLTKAQLAIAEVNLTEAESALENVSSDLEVERETKQKELVIAKSKLEDAQLAYDDAVSELEDAQNEDWNITAPYEGFITKVNLVEGSVIQEGGSAIEIADPNEFEAEVYVSEMDIFNIKVGVSATAQVDAAQTMILPAEVASISPTATIQQGVVNYAVKIKIHSTDDMTAGTEETTQTSGDTGSDELPAMLKRAVEAGRLTQEQAEKMAEAMENFEFPDVPKDFNPDNAEEGAIPSPFGGKGFSFSEGEFPSGEEGTEGEFTFPFAEASGTNETSTNGLQLREGLTVTVNIVTEEVNDVLLVPSAAITMKNGKNYVNVALADGTTEERAIETGVSDWQNTEVISGLSEGEQVVVTLTSSSSSTESGGFFMPGIGR